MRKEMLFTLVALSISGCSSSLSDDLSKKSLIDVIVGKEVKSEAPIKPTENFENESKPNLPSLPFRGFNWREDFSLKNKDLVFLRNEDGIKIYRYKKDNNMVGNVNMTYIDYAYYKNKLSGALLGFNGVNNFMIIKQSLDAKYGNPYQENPYIDKMMYTYGDHLTIMLYYSKVTDKGDIYYSDNISSTIMRADSYLDSSKAKVDL